GWFLGHAEPVLMAGDRRMRKRRTLRQGSQNMAGDRIAEMAGRQGSPYTGKLPARPAGRPGDFFIVEGEFATIPPTPPDSATARERIPDAPICVFSGMAESIWSDRVQLQKQSQNQILDRDHTAS